MRFAHRALAVAGAVAAMAAGFATSAAAAEPPTTAAEYHGQVVELSDAWAEGALVCAQQPAPGVEFRCYDDAADYRAAEGLMTPATDAGTLALSDCKDGRLCLWDNRQYKQRMVSFVRAGTYHLEDLDPPFHDRANSVANKRQSYVELVDTRSWPVADREYRLKPGGRIPDLGQLVYPGGGNWNNKIDKVVVN